MSEREPDKEIIGKGELFFLSHPDTNDIFSGYGLTMQTGSKGLLAGVLMVDRPRPADPMWLREVETTFGECRLIPMTASGERGILCRMQIERDSLPYLQQFYDHKAAAIQVALKPLLDAPPSPVFRLRWQEKARSWQSQFSPSETSDRKT